AEDGDRWRIRLDLRGVVELDLASRGLRRLSPGKQLPELLIDLGRGDALRALLLHLEQDLEQPIDALAGERRREEERNEPEIGRLFVGGLLVFRRRLVVLLGQVPLVDDDDQAAPRVPRERGDLEILVLDLALGGIDDEDADVGALDGPPR